jgi:hypothetical protein
MRLMPSQTKWFITLSSFDVLWCSLDKHHAPTQTHMSRYSRDNISYYQINKKCGSINCLFAFMWSAFRTPPLLTVGPVIDIRLSTYSRDNIDLLLNQPHVVLAACSSRDQSNEWPSCTLRKKASPAFLQRFFRFADRIPKSKSAMY